MHLNRHLVGWGLMLILIGAIPLAVRSGALDPGLAGHWPQLWPLILIAIGVSLLLSRTPAAWIGSLAVAAVVGVMGGGLLATGLGDLPNISGCGGGTAQPFATQGGNLADGGRIDIDFNCGTLAIATATSSTYAGGNWSLTGSDGAGRAPAIDTADNAVSIRSPNDSVPFGNRGKVSWNLTLPEDLSLDLGITLNAGEGHMELGRARLASLNATVNAGSLTTTLGSTAPANAVNLTVNAGTATITSGATSGTFNLSLNAGSLDVCVPPGSAVRVRWSGALASNDLDSLGLVKVDDHTWTSAGLSEGQAHVELDVSANAGSFKLSFGGGCHAP
jgi:hypothetical protein